MGHQGAWDHFVAPFVLFMHDLIWGWYHDGRLTPHSEATSVICHSVLECAPPLVQFWNFMLCRYLQGLRITNCFGDAGQTKRRTYDFACNAGITDF